MTICSSGKLFMQWWLHFYKDSLGLFIQVAHNQIIVKFANMVHVRSRHFILRTMLPINCGGVALRKPSNYGLAIQCDLNESNLSSQAPTSLPCWKSPLCVIGPKEKWWLSWRWIFQRPCSSSLDSLLLEWSAWVSSARIEKKVKMLTIRIEEDEQTENERNWSSNLK